MSSLKLKSKQVEYICHNCGKKVGRGFHTRCKECSGLLQASFNLNEYNFYPSKLDTERYWDFMPLENPETKLSLGNQPTPLVHSQKIGSRYQMDYLYLKDETRLPTKSSKDRLAPIALNHMVDNGITNFVTTSTGNTITSLAYLMDKINGLHMHCFISDEFAGRYKYLDSANITVHKIEGDYEVMGKKAKEFAKEHGYVWDGGFFNAARRAGLSLAFLEAYEQMQSDPDYYFQSVSSGMGVLGVYETAQRMLKTGYLKKLPRLMCIQQDSCNPMVKAYIDGSEVITEKHIVKNPQGCAKAILKGDPTDDYPHLLEAVKATGGTFISVSEAEIKEAESMLNTLENIPATPDGAVALAGAIKFFLNPGLKDKNEKVLVNITG